MQRTIKFRVWAKNDGGFYLKGDSFMFVQGKDTNGKDYFAPRAISPEIIVIQQFTGLTDKNGKEIYEGDLVKIDPSHVKVCLTEVPKYTNGEVVWRNGGFRVEQEYFGSCNISEYVACPCCGCGLEVIGNIYESI